MATTEKKMSRANEFDVGNLLDNYNLSYECVDYDIFCEMMQEIEIKTYVNVNKYPDPIDHAKTFKYKDRLREIVDRLENSRHHLEDMNSGDEDTDNNPYKLWVPLKDYSMSGKTHAIIRTNVEFSFEIGRHVVALIDFKNDRYIHSGTYHGIFKLIGKFYIVTRR